MTTEAATFAVPTVLPEPGLLAAIWAWVKRLGREEAQPLTPTQRKVRAVAHRLQHEVVLPLLRSKTTEEFDLHVEALTDSSLWVELARLFADEDVLALITSEAPLTMDALRRRRPAGRVPRAAAKAIEEALRVNMALLACAQQEAARAGQEWKAALAEAALDGKPLALAPIANAHFATMLAALALASGERANEAVGMHCVRECRRELWKYAACAGANVPDELLRVHLPELVPTAA